MDTLAKTHRCGNKPYAHTDAPCPCWRKADQVFRFELFKSVDVEYPDPNCCVNSVF